ncbi:AzlC family ABC transporter permease [Streptomyces sp. NPDC018045]|uniref:AzlC family ABC transporter permease n=1 Tax=Streptomyces sp. NPDC018045 TaxID=3365037 RepID=UPI00379C0267
MARETQRYQQIQQPRGPAPERAAGADSLLAGQAVSATGPVSAVGAVHAAEPGPEAGFAPAVEPASREKSTSAVVRDALGVGVAVGLSGFAFGVTAAGAGLSVWQACALSLLVFTGASQFALVGALAAGGNPFTAAAGAFFLGTRNAFYGLRLSGLLGFRAGTEPFAAHWVIDETSAVALVQPDRRSARLGFLVTGLTMYLLWNLTTLAGAMGAGALGDREAWGLDAAGPAVFVALLAPLLASAAERAVAGLAAGLLLVTLPLLPAGVPVLVAALAAPAVLCLEGRRARTRPTGDPDAGLKTRVQENGVQENGAREVDAR